MSDEKPVQLNKEKFVLGYDDVENPQVIVFTVPIKRVAEDKRGEVELFGEIEVMKKVMEAELFKIRQKRALSGRLVQPGGAIRKPNLKVQ